MSTIHLLAFLSLVIAAATVFISLCRLNAMSHQVLLRVRTEYACYVGGSIFAACGPWLGDWPGWPTIGLQVALLVGLMAGAYAWRNDIPPDVTTGPGDLRRADGSNT